MNIWIGSDMGERLKINEWLITKEFLARAEVPNRLYFEELCEHVYEYLKNTPVPVLSTFDPKNLRIYFTVGHDYKNWWIINEDYAFADMITLMRRWVKNFYPSYQVDYEDEVPLSEDEVWVKVREEGVKLEDALEMKKKVSVIETGVVGEITLSKDEFEFTKNRKKTLRVSGTLDNPLPLHKFIKYIRFIKDGREMRDYIFKNSLEIQEFPDKEDDVIIEYKDKKLKNFFIVNFPNLVMKQLYPIVDGDYKHYWRWGKYVIQFNSHYVQDECLEYVEEKRRELSMTSNDLDSQDIVSG